MRLRKISRTRILFVGTIISLLVFSATGEAAVTAFVMPDDGRSPFLEAINQAQQSLDMYIFRLTDAPIIEAIGSAVTRGVTVRALLEPCPGAPSGCTPEPQARDACDALIARGAQVKWANPEFEKTHAKAMVIDGTTALIMTLNFVPATFAERRDYAVKTDNPDVIEDLRGAFSLDWHTDATSCTGSPSDRPKIPDEQVYPTLIVSPVNGPDILDVIRSATASLKIQMQTISNRPEIIDAIVSGIPTVRVQVLLAPPDQEPGNQASADAINAAGGDARFQQNFRVHAKLIIVDEQKAFVGSHNLTRASLNRRREIGWVTEDGGTVARFNQTFDADWAATPSGRIAIR